MTEFIARRLALAGIEPSPPQLRLLVTYFGLLTKWNRTVNLTALALDPPSEEAVARLLVEPLLAARALEELSSQDGRRGPLRLLDVGSGGGSPAIPLGIALVAELRMVESKGRKAAFLREAIRTLELPGAEVFGMRLEELEARSDLHGTFDLVSVRAVRADRDLWRLLSCLVRSNGKILWFRSANESSADVEPFLVEAVRPLVRGSELAILRLG